MMDTLTMRKQVASPAGWSAGKALSNHLERSKRRYAWLVRPFALCMLLLAFLGSTLYSWQLDPLSAPLDLGIISVLLFAALALVGIKQLSAWLTLRTFKPHFNKITPWQKVLFFGALYLSYFWGSVLVLIALL